VSLPIRSAATIRAFNLLFKVRRFTYLIGTRDFDTSNGVRFLEKFNITEMPEIPFGLKVLDKSGRTVQLSWLAPYDGNSPITRYIVQYKLLKGKRTGSDGLPKVYCFFTPCAIV